MKKPAIEHVMCAVLAVPLLGFLALFVADVLRLIRARC